MILDEHCECLPSESCIKTMRTSAIFTLFMGYAVYLSSCGGREDLPCPEGDESCGCYGNETCNSGLTCVDGTCVRTFQKAYDDAVKHNGGEDSSGMNGEDSSGAIAPTGDREGGASTTTDAARDADRIDAAGNRPQDSGTGGTAGTAPAGSGGSDAGNGGVQDAGGSGGNGGSGGSVRNDFAMYIMLDSSASMLIPDLTLAVKWDIAVDGINAFVAEPASAGMNIALQYFPIASDIDEICDSDLYETPAVPLGRLPENTQAISDSLSLMPPIGDSTPTEAALVGMTEFCQKYKNDPIANPTNESCIPVLITDGMPEACNTDLTYLASIVADVYSNHGITTYVVGMFGADFFMIEALNQHGGWDCESMRSCQLGSSTPLSEALRMIRDAR